LALRLLVQDGHVTQEKYSPRVAMEESLTSIKHLLFQDTIARNMGLISVNIATKE